MPLSDAIDLSGFAAEVLGLADHQTIHGCCCVALSFFPPFDLSASREGSKNVERVKMQEDAMVACVSNSICKFNPLSNSRLR